MRVKRWRGITPDMDQSRRLASYADGGWKLVRSLMSEQVRIPVDARVLVADARKALFLANVGSTLSPKLRVERVIDADSNPPTSAQGTDRPGRVQFGERRSSVDQTDWHRQAEAAFAADVTAALSAEDGDRPLVLVAPPSFLAELRHRLPASVKSRLFAEIAKDLTPMPIEAIERHLVGT
jgi:protein required for attachment to host cells